MKSLVKGDKTTHSNNWPFSCFTKSSFLLDSSAVVSKSFALFTQQLRVDLGLVGNVQAVGFLQGTLFVRIHVDVALDALLAVVGPRVPGHPLPLALGALVLAEATLLALVRRLAFGLGTSLRTISNVVALLEAQVTQIICRWNFAVLLVLLAVIDPPQQRMLMLLMIRISSIAQKRSIQASSRSWTNPTIPKPVQALQTV